MNVLGLEIASKLCRAIHAYTMVRNVVRWCSCSLHVSSLAHLHAYLYIKINDLVRCISSFGRRSKPNSLALHTRFSRRTGRHISHWRTHTHTLTGNEATAKIGGVVAKKDVTDNMEYYVRKLLLCTPNIRYI